VTGVTTDEHGSDTQNDAYTLWLASHPAVLAYATLRSHDPSMPERCPSDVVKYLTGATFLRSETQRQAGLKAATGHRFDYSAFPSMTSRDFDGCQWLENGSSTPDLLRSIEEKARQSGVREEILLRLWQVCDVSCFSMLSWLHSS
jgi:hypothetical protein